MPGSLLVARVLGIDIRIHLSWLLIFGLIVLTLVDEVLPQLRPDWSDQRTLIVGVITALLFFTSVLVHELAHALVARRFKMQVSSITLFLLGGVANLTKEPPSAKAEFLMAGAGPFASFVIGGLGLLVANITHERLAFTQTSDAVGVVANYLGIINIALGVFNLIPGFPLDGGRVFRSIIWGIRKDRSAATRIAGRGGQVFAVLLFGVAIFRFFAWDDPLGGVWSALIAYFLFSAAGAAITQERVTHALGDARVSVLLSGAEQPVAPSGISVGRLIREIVVPKNLRAVPVVWGTKVIGLVTIGDLRKVEQAAWDTTPVDQVMARADHLVSVAPEDTLVVALERFATSELPVLLVLSRDVLVGVLDREAVFGYLRMRESLGLR